MTPASVLAGAASYLQLYQQHVLPQPGAEERLQELAARQLGGSEPFVTRGQLFPCSASGTSISLTELSAELALLDPHELQEATKGGRLLAACGVFWGPEGGGGGRGAEQLRGPAPGEGARAP
jgi:hypothetical protein